MYEFDRPSWFKSIYSDEDLKNKCGVYSNNTSWKAITKQFMEGTQTPHIYTKCGTVTPIPLNKWHSKDTVPPPPRTIWNASVPNIVHYVNFGSREFSFLNFISFLSVHRFIDPRFIYIHGDGLPHGYWWNKTRQEVPRLFFVPREKAVRVQGYKLPWIEHSSDILRFQTIYGKLAALILSDSC